MVVTALENRPVQPFLAAEVVVNHPLDGVRALGNLIDAAAAEALLREFLGGNGENVRPGAVGIARGGGGHADRGTAGGSPGGSSSRSRCHQSGLVSLHRLGWNFGPNKAAPLALRAERCPRPYSGDG